MRAPRSTRISSDNDSFRWNVYLLVTRGKQAPKPHRVLAIFSTAFRDKHSSKVSKALTSEPEPAATSRRFSTKGRQN